MKTFNYKNEKHYDLLDQLRVCQGKMEVIKKGKLDVLEESYYSTKIEGIILDYNKCKNIVKHIKNEEGGIAGDVSDFEQQFRGYAKVLLTINKRLEFFNIDTTSVLAFAYSLFNIPANYKKSIYRKNDYQQMIQDNKIVDVKVSPVESYETPLYLGAATQSLKEDFNIISIPKFMVDFMCIRPFDAGCGRIARMMMYLLLLKADIDIVKYVSVSKIFEENASEYYESMSKCCDSWDKNKNTYEPFIEYFLKSLIKAYNIYFKKTNTLKLKKQDQIYEYFKAHKRKISKQELVENHPNISLSTIENALHKLKEKEDKTNRWWQIY